MMIVVYFTSSAFNTEQYMALGIILAVICVLIVIVGMARVGYNVHYKIMDRKLEKELS